MTETTLTRIEDFPISQRWPASNPEILQLYSYPTPNGVKVSIALEEMDLDYEAHLVTLADSDVKSPEFLSLNPNNKIPAIIDPDGPDGQPIALFESGAILLYLAEKPASCWVTDRRKSQNHPVADVPDGRCRPDAGPAWVLFRICR
ncbi:glutathione S-transferase N-terminal domain-containing protein [Aliamphritea spongicola]|nr:glutathione S-transferase N-terminal domain-containing protein [Aliamphritea spongicola]